MMSAGLALVFGIVALVSGQPMVGLLFLVLGGLLVLRLALVKDAPRSVRKGGTLPGEDDSALEIAGSDDDPAGDQESHG
jgi:hypothetical protein